MHCPCGPGAFITEVRTLLNHLQKGNIEGSAVW